MATQASLKKEAVGKNVDHNEQANCVFCHIAWTAENESWVCNLKFGGVFLNHNQSFEGRCLYIPFQHYQTLENLSEEQYINYNREILFISNNLKKELHADLMNTALLTNKVRHIHWHIIPRYANDSNWGEAPWPNHPVEIEKSALATLKKRIRTALLSRVQK